MHDSDPADAQLRADLIAVWERWAHRHYPQDIGDEGGWDESVLDEWLRFAKQIVLTDGEVRPSTRHRPEVR